jgi:hypothetical protein
MIELEDIEILDAHPSASIEEINALIGSMDEETRLALQAVFETMVKTIAGKAGTVVIVMDVFGIGHAQMLALGDPLAVPRLLEASSRIADHLYKPQDGVLQ